MGIEIAKGPARGRALDIVIKDNGRATCNGGSEEMIPSDLLIDARELERNLGDLAEEGAFFEPTGAGRRECARARGGTGDHGRAIDDVRPGHVVKHLVRDLGVQLLALRLDRLLCR